MDVMKNLRTYGSPPFSVAVVHGGPGAGGEMAPVGRRLASGWGVLEPLQTARSLDGQVEELKNILKKTADLPVTLIGFSWGAWLSFILAARYPETVKKLILIASGPFEDSFVAEIRKTRFSRLSDDERNRVCALFERLTHPGTEDKNRAFASIGKLFSKTDAYDPIFDEPETIEYRADIFERVWPEGAGLRRSGNLLQLAGQITCPVVAIHGDHDPHPAEGVRRPLAAAIKHFRFILLERCGHRPWIERHARKPFSQILETELK